MLLFLLYITELCLEKFTWDFGSENVATDQYQHNL
jgi:hypothetical protein